MEPKAGDRIVVWFSCGAASAVAAKKTLELYGNTCEVIVVNNPVEEEDPDNIRFLEDVEKWLEVSIEKAVNPKYPECSAERVWQKRKFMSSPQGAPCTLELKKRARQHWEETNHVDWHVLGFTCEEESRLKRFRLTERENTLGVLVDLGVSKRDCFKLLQEEGVNLPNVYLRGYPNANCLGCVKATSPTYWNHVRKEDPGVFEKRAKQSREIGAKLVRYKGTRVFLDELPEDAKGRPMKGIDFECGIFCEEKF